MILTTMTAKITTMTAAVIKWNKNFTWQVAFSLKNPAFSPKIQNYIAEKFQLPIIRCCVANYKVEEFENRMPENYRADWQKIEHYRKFPAGSTMVSLCHNCAAIFEERPPEILRQSLWELILEDKNFNYPNYGGEKNYSARLLAAKGKSRRTKCSAWTFTAYELWNCWAWGKFWAN